MKNPYEIRNEKKLFFILDEEKSISIDFEMQNKCGIFVNLYYLDDVDIYCKYLDKVSENVDIYIISSNKELIDVVKDRFIEKRNVQYIFKTDNTGRDITAFLIEGSKYYSKYEYVCFLHDKKEHQTQEKKDIELWIDNIWGNLIGTTDTYIGQIIDLFENNKNIGCLFPPDPIGEYFCSWYGFGWHGSFNVTKALAENLRLECDLSEAYPPVGLGTVLWFRTSVLKKLYDYQWDYSDFDDDKLCDTNYISYGIERIFPYVAQDAGYDSGEVMTLQYARVQNSILKDETRKIIGTMYEYFPFPTVESLEKVPEKVKELLSYAKENEPIVLYGAGQMGKFCLSILRKNGIEPLAFIDNNMANEKVDALAVKSLSEFANKRDVSVIVTPIKSHVQQEIISELKRGHIDKYHVFWG